jgi:Piwi domain
VKPLYSDLTLTILAETFEELREPPSKITFIVVGKRHHIRFFPSEGQAADRNGNCMAGTIVDTNIVHPVYDDFYLQSQKGLIGTSRSGHYTLLHDDNGISVDVYVLGNRCSLLPLLLTYNFVVSKGCPSICVIRSPARLRQFLFPLRFIVRFFFFAPLHSFCGGF